MKVNLNLVILAFFGSLLILVVSARSVYPPSVFFAFLTVLAGSLLIIPLAQKLGLEED